MKQLAIAASALMLMIGTSAFAQSTTPASPAPPTSTGAENPGGSATAGPTGTNNRSGATTPSKGEYTASSPMSATPPGNSTNSNVGANRSADCPQGTTSNQMASEQSQMQCANPTLTPGTTGTENKPVLGH